MPEITLERPFWAILQTLKRNLIPECQLIFQFPYKGEKFALSLFQLVHSQEEGINLIQQLFYFLLESLEITTLHLSPYLFKERLIFCVGPAASPSIWRISRRILAEI